MVDRLLGRVSGGEDLTRQEMASVIDAVMRGEWAAERIALLLTGLHHKGETAEEIAGAAEALRRHMTPIASSRDPLVDTCGTGGDGSGTFNISTAAGLVAAAAGVPIAKHGNRKITSKTGSADALAALGVAIDAPVPVVQRCLEQLGICFCFAPLLHPAMKQVAAVRRQLPFRTIFNLLGPLSNPAAAPYQLLGVGDPALRPLLADVLAQLGTRRAAVVHGSDGLDEVSLAAETEVSYVAGGDVTSLRWSPEDFGVPRVADYQAMQVEDADQSARMITAILAGELGPPRDIVLINAAAAIWLTQPESSLADCAQRAAAAIDCGAARELLGQLVTLSSQ